MAAFGGEGGVAAAVGQRGEVGEDTEEEEAEPDAFAAAFVANAVHAVVPVAAAHEGQAVGAGGERAADGADAMLVERGGIAGDAGLVVEGFLAISEQAGFEEGDGFGEHAGIAGGGDVAGGGVGQPQEIVGDAGARAAAGGGKPPVLDVAFLELARGADEQMFAGQPGAFVQEREGILQLVAEAVGAAGLVEAGAAPEARG